jgi:peptidyl-prolyl cis-trans isomerase A (cyclophilin A)
MIANEVRADSRAGSRIALFIVMLFALTYGACNHGDQAGNRMSGRTAVIETDLGTIKVELLEDESPQTVENFRQLAARGYYDGIIFHRVINGFMIQGGDPQGDGRGGETATGAPLPNEINTSSPLYQGGYKRGMLAMANKGRPETASSQFFIMHQDRPPQMLPPVYTVFGRVIEGMDVVDKIATAPNTGGSTMNRPVSPVKMNKVYIE